MKTLKIILAVAIILTQKSNAQQKVFKIPDTLKNKSINYIVDRMDENEDNDSLDSIYAYTYLLKSKSANDYENIIKAYNTVMHKSRRETWLQYCDSMLTVAKRSKDNALIGSSYLTRGIVYYSFKQETKALDNFIIADGFLSKTNDQYLKYKTKYGIAQIKYYLGYYDEAISLFKECEEYFRKNEPGRPHLNTLHSLSLCYIKTKQYDLARATSDLGYREAIDIDEPATIPYFINSEGQNDYFQKNYRNAIEKLQKSLPAIIKNKDLANASTTNFYIGRSYWALGDKEKAIPYFKKVDEAFRNENFMKEDLLEAYDLMAQYYEAKGNPSEQLKYLTGLLKAETFVSQKFRYLAVNMHRQYDLKKIVEATEELKRELFFRDKMDIIFGVLFLIVTIVLGYIICRQYQRRKQRKQKFKGIISHKDRITSPVPTNEKIVDGDLIIKPEIVTAVSNKLKQFENSDVFLDKDFTLNKMAAFVDCNTRYTSRIIFETRKKKYIEYVDDLRIDYIVNRLKTDSKFRNYTIKALTDEAGFKSPQKFKEAFVKSTELTPLYFIRELKKEAAK
jgi:tetratricopeptide (TPR) repeat protein